MADLLDALRQIDPEDDANWTAEGLVRLNVLPQGTTRRSVTDTAPDFTRELARKVLAESVAAPDVPPEPEPTNNAPPAADKESHRQRIRDEMSAIAAERDEAQAKADDAQAAVDEVNARYAAVERRLIDLQGNRAEQFRESQQRYLRQQFENRKVRGRSIAALKAGLGTISKGDAAMIREAIKPAR